MVSFMILCHLVMSAAYTQSFGLVLKHTNVVCNHISGVAFLNVI